MEKYSVISTEEVDGKILVMRLSDSLRARCKLSWLAAGGGTNVYVARSNTKAIKLDGLEWTTEG